MVRNYTKKNIRAKWSTEALQDSLDAVNGGMKISDASKMFGISWSTIKDHVKQRSRNAAGVPGRPKKVGRTAVFSEKQELEIVDYCLEISKRFYGLTVNEFRSIIFQFAEKLGLNHPFNKTEKKAGIDFYYGFMKRHRNLSLRTPEATSINRVISFNRTAIDTYFNNLNMLYEKHTFSPADIYNVDETGLHTVHRPGRIISQKGVKQIGKITSAERGDLVTAICCMNAAGNYIPPMLLYPRKLMNDRLLKNAPPGTIGAATGNGWSNSDAFVKWLAHFISHAKPNKDRRVCLILDNHESHLSLAAYEMAKENGVDMISLPPHTSHRTQPLDLVFFGPLKNNFNYQCSYWMKSNAGKRITIYEIAELFAEAYQKVATIEKCVNGFKAAGIWPFQPTIFTEEDFVASNALQPKNAGPYNVQSGTQSEVPERATCSKSVDSIININNRTPEKENSGSSIIKLKDILPMPTQSKNGVQKRNHKRKSSEIITATPMKEILEEKQRKANLKKNKQSNKAKNSHIRNVFSEIRQEKAITKTNRKKKQSEDLTSSSESDDPILSSGDDDTESFSDLLQEFPSLTEEPKKHDHVLVQFEIPKLKQPVYYVGKILTEIDQNREYEISFFRRSSKVANAFVSPNAIDISMVHLDRIKMILPSPKLHGTTKRQHSFLEFGISFDRFDVR